MLGLLGLMSAIAAGIMADAMLQPAGSAEDDSRAPPDDDSRDVSADTDGAANVLTIPLDWTASDNTMAPADQVDAADAPPPFTGNPVANLATSGSGGDLIATLADPVGSAGPDAFALHDIIAGGPVARISDYRAAEDDLLVVYDSVMHPDPQLTVEHIAGSSDITVLLDGVALAVVQGADGLDVSQVTLRAA